MLSHAAPLGTPDSCHFFAVGPSRSLPGLYPPDAAGLQPAVVTIKSVLPDTARVPKCAKAPPGEPLLWQERRPLCFPAALFTASRMAPGLGVTPVATCPCSQAEPPAHTCTQARRAQCSPLQPFHGHWACLSSCFIPRFTRHLYQPAEGRIGEQSPGPTLGSLEPTCLPDHGRPGVMGPRPDLQQDHLLE